MSVLILYFTAFLLYLISVIMQLFFFTLLLFVEGDQTEKDSLITIAVTNFIEFL